MASKTTGTRAKSTDSSLEPELRRIVTEAVEEAHDEGVEHGSSSRGGSGRSSLPLLFVAGALGVAAVLLWRRSSQSGDGGGVSEHVRETAKEAAERTDEVSEAAADRVEEGGETVAERADEVSEQAAQRVEEGGETVASEMDDAAESGEESSSAAGRQ
ncbi:YtxH domain-containing protein [Halobacterium jilantaiense]|uniref:Uncharacterized protein n=1 Tax=Halobacterium jilantaiense TaxID=355548 RepID=A0A1I0P8M6_9EURY|nr:YtxH domain-containing protein [Halobacterium jilantaiense]SEW10634.1 hypothetical protein SAMN04487945_1485 [Halobacterium jilantaiense]